MNNNIRQNHTGFFGILFTNKGFYPRLLAISLPIIFQNMFMSCTNFIDVLMIGQLGAVAIAAVGIANQVFFIHIMLIYGVSSSCAIFVSQFWGSRDIANIRRVMGMGLLLVSGFGLSFTFFVFLFPAQLMAFFTSDAKVIHEGAVYLRFTALSYGLSAVNILLSICMRSVEYVKITTITSITGLTLNSVFNYLLIFGNFGFPKWEVKGAAIATCIAWSCQLSLTVFINYYKKLPTAARWNELWTFSGKLLKRYIRTAGPVILHSVGWVVGVSVYQAIYARISTESLAAYNVAASIEKLVIMLFVAMGTACQIMVGKEIGAGREDLAYDYAKKFILICVLCSLPLMLLLVLFRESFIALYNLDTSGQAYAGGLIVVMSMVLWAKVINILLNMGIFRAGGDTAFSMFLDLGGVWLVGVPMGIIAALVFKLGIIYVAAFIVLEEIVKNAVGLPRFFSKRWMKNVTKDVH